LNFIDILTAGIQTILGLHLFYEPPSLAFKILCH